MKILFLGDYSNLHALLAREMRRRGHDVTLVSDRCNHMDADCDIYLARDSRPFNGVRYLANVLRTLPRLRGYDVVQLINPGFLSLRPEKLRRIASFMLKNNGALFLSLAGNDSVFVEKCLDGKTFRFSEFRVGDKPTEYASLHPELERGYLLPEMRDYTLWLYDNIRGGMSCLPEYHMAAESMLGERLMFTNLPVDLDELTFSPMETPEDGKVRILVGMRKGYEMRKGTDRLLAIARNLERSMPEKVEVVNVSNLPWNDYKRVLASCHINLDQLYSYSPAMNALSSMSLGRVAATGAEPEYYSILTDSGIENHDKPLIRLSPLEENITETLTQLIENPTRLRSMGEDARHIVERNNALSVVASRYEKHWLDRLTQL